MRVMVFVKATEDSENGFIGPPEAFEAMGRFNDELVNAGILLAADGLTPSSHGKRIAFDGASRTAGWRFGWSRNLSGIGLCEESSAF